MKSKPLSCRRVRVALLRLADGELELEERFTLDAHLETCADCRALHEGLALMDEGTARLSARGAQSAERLDLDDAVARLDTALDADPDTRASARPAFAAEPSRRLRLVAVAALVTALFGGAVWRLLDRGAESDEPEPLRVADIGETPEATGDTGAPQAERRTDVPVTDAAVEQAARAAASARLAGALVRELGGLEAADELAHGEAAARVDAALADLVASGWPLARLAEGLVHQPDVESAAAALLYLGSRGDGATAGRLGALLDDDDLSAPALQALGALARRGIAGGVAGLERALGRAALAPDALSLLGRARSKDAAAALCAALRSRSAVARLAAHFGDTNEARNALLAALVEVGPSAVAPLYELASASQRGALGEPSSLRVLQAIARIDGHGPALADRLEHDAGSALAFEAVRASADPVLLPWLEARAGSTRTSDEAVALLAELPGAAVVDVLVRLARRDRFEPSVMEGVLARVLTLDSSRVAHWIEARDELLRQRQLQGHGRAGGPVARLELEAFARLLLATPSPAAGPALCALTSATSLSADDRTWAALALAEVGREEDLGRLLDTFEEKAGDDPLDARLFAAQLLALQKNLGSRAARRALLAHGVVRVEEVVQVLEVASERGALAVEFHRVARALEDRRGAGLAQLQRRNSQ